VFVPGLFLRRWLVPRNGSLSCYCRLLASRRPFYRTSLRHLARNIASPGRGINPGGTSVIPDESRVDVETSNCEEINIIHTIESPLTEAVDEALVGRAARTWPDFRLPESNRRARSRKTGQDASDTGGSPIGAIGFDPLREYSTWHECTPYPIARRLRPPLRLSSHRRHPSRLP